MSLTGLLKERRLQRHRPTRDELEGLFLMARQSLRDAEVGRASGLSSDWRFAIAYGAVLSLAAVVLRAEGYRPRGEGHHATLFDALPLIMPDRADLASYFQECRRKRNRLTYEAPQQASEQEASFLLEKAHAFHRDVERWLGTNHPELFPGAGK